MEAIKGIHKVFQRTPYIKSGGPGGPGDGPPPPPPMPAVQAASALEVRDGKVVARKELLQGKVTDESASDLILNVNDPSMGGVYVHGKNSDYAIEHCCFRISGTADSFCGQTSGIFVDDHGSLTLKNCRINMDGKQRLATCCMDNSTLKVYDSLLVSHGEAWPVDKKEVIYEVNESMSAAPVYLEIEGNMRTHCTMGNSGSYFYDSTIIADSWAALSTDIADGHVYLEANRCNVITTRSGYGTYADTDCHSVLNDCTLNVQSMAAIISGEARVELNRCSAKCGNYVVLNHVVGGGSNEALLSQVSSVNIVGGSYQCEDAAVVCKSVNSDILFDGAEIKSYAHTLLRSRINDDPSAPDAGGHTVYGIHAVIKDMKVSGDIKHEDPYRPMSISLKNSELFGSITGGVYVSVDKDSKWFAEDNSDVILNSDVLPGQIDAPQGVVIKAFGSEEKSIALPSGGMLTVKPASV